jgi:hypothetical protein
MIDLSQFVGKRVRVTLRSGKLIEGRIVKTDSSHKPYHLFDYNGVYNIDYAKDGRYYVNFPETANCDIIKIEEIKTMSFETDPFTEFKHYEEIKTMKKYEELENQVAEMQKEIDRLKRGEKNYPKLKPVEIIRTVRFTPEEYFEWCEDYEEKPTAAGYIDYYSSDGWFMNSDNYTQEIKEVEN